MDNYVNLSSSDSVEWSGEASHHPSGSSSPSYAEVVPITFNMIYFPHLQPPDGQSLKLPAFATRYFNVNMPFRTTLIDELQYEIPVTLQKMDACLEITDGWAIFRDSHGIKPRDFFVFNLFEDHSMEVQIYCPCGGEVLVFPSRGCHTHYFHNSDALFQITRHRPTISSFLLHADDGISTAARQFTSTNPHFIRWMTIMDFSRPLMLRLPVPVVQFLPQECRPMTLSFGGKTWEIICSNSEHGGVFVAGWKEFVEDNNVNCLDSLVFEICDNDKIKVEIFRYLSSLGL
ncbi:hypothetical protein COLO4_35725 [Corchorus olitorius]|uniref:TF-B3 domain-containing protein n=1 Tax=Corchorus olitorius TaxID=93759 RepID=A0A1R3GDT8_9ROSI|nr:hypothetical protein COLO4_35725 [Corchorus olitorius]